MAIMAHGGAVLTLFLIALSFATVDSAILSNKERKDRPTKLNWRQAKQLLHRERRSTSNSSSVGKVFSNEVTLNGSEYHNRAYVHWSGKGKSDVMFILTLKLNSSGVVESQLWRSVDYGTSFTEYSFGDGAVISIFYISPVNMAKMVFVDKKNKNIYTTTDELQSHQKLPLKVASDNLYPHPTQSDWMLLYDDELRQLYVTMDFGHSWTLLYKDANSNFDWAVPGQDDAKTVHVEVQPKDSSQAYYARCTIPYCNSTGDGIDSVLGPYMTTTMLVINEFIFVQKGNEDGTNSRMMVSHNRGKFAMAHFPFDIQTQDFRILDAEEGQVFLAVNHGNHAGASLYLSDPKGQYYVLSLPRVHHRAFNRYFTVDIHRVRGLNGTYLANQLMADNYMHVKSLISYNKGGDWLNISAPTSSQCNKTNCSLVLRLDMDNFYMNWILSEKNAPGFLIAHGHYGHHYYYGWNRLTVFTSVDGGWNWTESQLRGIYHFNILDHGSIVTAIKSGYQENASQIFYSYDEGMKWHQEQVKNGTLFVDGVLNEPNINTLVLGVYGHVSRSSPWTLVKVNFSEVLTRNCQHSDYDKWMASDHDTSLQENCLLGQAVTYQRKKRKSVCFNGEPFERSVNKTACPCGEEDFECDFGFHGKGLECQKETWFTDDYIAPECNENELYTQSKGYRKVGSDKCVGGVANKPKYQTVNVTCPLVAPRQLVLEANMTLVPTGQPILFHLFQKRGSVHLTNYTWNFNDSYKFTVTGLQKAQHQTHTFRYQGLFHVQVNASNAKNYSVSPVLRVRAEHPVRRVAVFCAWASQVGFPVRISATTNVWQSQVYGGLHFQYRFGDESYWKKELLTWNSSVSHTYRTSGTFTISVTAINSISAVTKQVTIVVVDKGIVVQLSFSSNGNRLFPFNLNYFSETIFNRLEAGRNELSVALGVSRERLALALNSTRPLLIDVLILPKPDDEDSAFDMTAEEVAESFKNLSSNNSLALFKSAGLPSYYGDITVTGVRILDYSGSMNESGSSDNHTINGNGTHTSPVHDTSDNRINKRDIYIAVPVAGALCIITVMIIICYRRRKRAHAHRFSLLGRDSSADPYMDDDDDLPLDLADARDTGRDDALLSLGGGM